MLSTSTTGNRLAYSARRCSAFLASDSYHPLSISADRKRMVRIRRQECRAASRAVCQPVSVVEVDSTYYSLPSEHTAELWAERTPTSFLDAKAYRLLTQHPGQMTSLPKSVPGDAAKRGD